MNLSQQFRPLELLGGFAYASLLLKLSIQVLFYLPFPFDVEREFQTIMRWLGQNPPITYQIINGFLDYSGISCMRRQSFWYVINAEMLVHPAPLVE